MATENYFFMVFSLLGFIITALPLPWQWRSKHSYFYYIWCWFTPQHWLTVIGGLNSGICIFRYWNATWCLILFIDAIIWNENLIDHDPVWCAKGISITSTCMLCLIPCVSGSLLNSRDRGHISGIHCDFSQHLHGCFSRIREHFRNGSAPWFNLYWSWPWVWFVNSPDGDWSVLSHNSALL